MIRVRYEYLCDFCGADIHPSESYDISNRSTPTEPRAVQGVGSYLHACDRCADAAIRGVNDALLKQGITPGAWKEEHGLASSRPAGD